MAELENIFSASLQGLKDMVDVDTIIGNPIETSDGTTIIPISRVSFGFGMGGMDNKDNDASQDSPKTTEKKRNLVGGGSGGGVSISPIGFLVVSRGEVTILRIDDPSPLDRAIEVFPDAVSALTAMFKRRD